jgi:hypothetical protein
MVYDNMIQQLHDNSTRGKPLSLEEQSLLEQWYAFQETAENTTLVNTLQTQEDNALTQLIRVTTKRVQELTAENELLKHEIIELRRQLIKP